MAQIKPVETDSELEGILELQSRNLEKNISSGELKDQGFVTVHHNKEILAAMNKDIPSIIAVDSNSRVIGYTLSMTKRFRNTIDILVPMFDMIDTLYYKNHNLQELDYLIGGQVCIEKNFRGKGLFYKLYNYAQQSYKSSYTLMLTEVSDRNPRSVKAHLNCGFEIIHSYQMTDQESWSILAWNWNLAD